MINSVPSIIVNSAITEEDMNPWFIVGPPPSAGSRCCLLSNVTAALRVLSLTYYMDYPSTPVDFGEHGNFMSLMQSFNIALDFLHQKPMIDLRKKSQDKRKPSNSINMLLGRYDNIGTNNVHTLNIRKPPEYYSWSKRSTRASIKSLFRLFFPEYGVSGYGAGYTLD
ncbi:hypothetical protein AX774_g1523 [Zancudomyces culisetae]|uniref:Uncharacterized protein n=1 Tax=Zancudomyces culisetae TaxID=1213189 RepID=A0A1R1PVJ6_ZANCU|nr:hypothetical protein AX774_g1523 [Zancudomyces culisetae]|eukprot:OMH84949.1 hypothetical protein AX774_g1523 [Zancudomyces culisetae]